MTGKKGVRRFGAILAIIGLVAAVVGVALPGALVGVAAHPLAIPLVVVGMSLLFAGLLMVIGVGARQAEYYEILEEMRREKRKKP